MTGTQVGRRIAGDRGIFLLGFPRWRAVCQGHANFLAEQFPGYGLRDLAYCHPGPEIGLIGARTTHEFRKSIQCSPSDILCTKHFRIHTKRTFRMGLGGDIRMISEGTGIQISGFSQSRTELGIVPEYHSLPFRECLSLVSVLLILARVIVPGRLELSTGIPKTRDELHAHLHIHLRNRNHYSHLVSLGGSYCDISRGWCGSCNPSEPFVSNQQNAGIYQMPGNWGKEKALKTRSKCTPGANFFYHLPNDDIPLQRRP